MSSQIPYSEEVRLYIERGRKTKMRFTVHAEEGYAHVYLHSDLPEELVATVERATRLARTGDNPVLDVEELAGWQIRSKYGRVDPLAGLFRTRSDAIDYVKGAY